VDEAHVYFVGPEAGAAGSEAAAVPLVPDGADCSLTALERLISASWSSDRWSLRTTGLQRYFKALENRLCRLAEKPRRGDSAQQDILLRATRNKVERSLPNIKGGMDKLQDRRLPLSSGGARSTPLSR
jgi:hypothetical protein